MAESRCGFDSQSRRRILVAEDDAEMRRIVAETLRKDGYDVDEASDGGRLLAALAAPRAPDLIISDVRMPVCNGLQILERLRMTSRRVPVILMTAFGDENMRGQATRLGAVLIDKPFALSVLLAAVRSALSSQ